MQFVKVLAILMLIVQLTIITPSWALPLEKRVLPRDPQKCVDTQLCIIGYTWSPNACKCVPDN
ncbi:23326_t:CDS:2 [Dentiscutata erythropus]|uniref:23326_t:CDS:1 n=1 Tax=Dentiscutata erythropus TaxID=1348616 RepID=A0A9N9EA01_9GLOM|nr:23326_t:CDS:2 [Dentiscutata erythropus]